MNYKASFQKLNILIILFLFAPALVYAESNFDNIFVSVYYETLADKLFSAKEIPGNLDSTIKYYKKALKYNPSNKNVDWKMARCYWLIGDISINAENK